MSNIYYEKFKQKCFAIIGNKCARCGLIEDLEIDHIDRSSKSFSISALWSKKGFWPQIEIELQKCQPLCESCHAEKTGKELGDERRKDRSLMHGTISQYYIYKCRCVLCKKAYSIYRKQQRQKHLVEHGYYT